jgi:F-type H+-transporting ATPase subunit b
VTHPASPFRQGLRILRLVVLLALSVRLAIGPLRLLAQQPHPAPTAAQADNSELVSEKQIEHDEEKGDNAFRHSAVIKTVARALHLSTETTASGFEIINIAIVIFGIGIPLYRFLPRFLRQRGDKVSHDIESARKQTEDASSRLSAVEARLAHLDEEIARYRAEMEEEMRADETRIKATLETERDRVVAQAQHEIDAAAAQARRGLRRFAAELAIDNASKQIALTPETDRMLIAEFVANGTKGGQG